jgi:hypothetical protein
MPSFCKDCGFSTIFRGLGSCIGTDIYALRYVMYGRAQRLSRGRAALARCAAPDLDGEDCEWSSSGITSRHCSHRFSLGRTEMVFDHDGLLLVVVSSTDMGTTRLYNRRLRADSILIVEKTRISGKPVYIGRHVGVGPTPGADGTKLRKDRLIERDPWQFGPYSHLFPPARIPLHRAVPAQFEKRAND